MIYAQGNTAKNKGLKDKKVSLNNKWSFLKAKQGKYTGAQVKYDWKSHYLSLCFGQTYPEERMLRERMFGSMMVSSASGLFRIRPETSPGRRRNILLKGLFTLKAREPTLALEMITSMLTNNKLLHLLPLKIISSFMSDRDGDSPLDALCNTDGKKTDSRLIL